MNSFQRGNPINLVERFWTIDPLTGAQVLADPTDVVFTLTDPDSVVTTFTFPGSPRISNPDVGIYVCALDPLLPTGIYQYVCVGSGAVVASSPLQTFEIIETSVTAPDNPNVPVTGPCQQWISGQDVAACANLDYGYAANVFDTVAYNASIALYEISGRIWPGVCERTVRPARGGCSCWLTGPISYGMGPWYWTTAPWGFGGGWAWYNERGDKLGCAPMSRVRLAGTAREIVGVTLDGADFPEFDVDTGARNWRLDDRRYLTRMDSPGNPSVPNFWPGCQNMSLDDDQPGTFSVTYRWGMPVPQLGRDAAVEVANQLWLACGGQQCVLPAGVVRVSRQGIEIERGLLANWADPKKPTGLVNLDLFLQSEWEGMRRGRRSAFWSPDLQPFARKLGT